MGAGDWKQKTLALRLKSTRALMEFLEISGETKDNRQ